MNDLLSAARLGTSGARDALAKAILPIAYAAAIAATRDRHAAEDVAQEAVLRAFASLDRVRDDARFGAYVVRIARNCAVDRARKGLREQVVPQPPSPGSHDVAADESGVLGAWRRLPEDERLVIWLTVQGAYPLREAADLMGLSRSGTHRLQTRALSRLRKELGHVST